MTELEKYYNKFNEDKRLTRRHGNVEFITSMKYIQKYLEKIRRLCTLMVQIEGAEDPIAWYRTQYPGLSDRTRQRDFKELDKIGYQIGYNPLRNPDRDWDPHYEPGWYCDFPTGAYDITF